MASIIEINVKGRSTEIVYTVKVRTVDIMSINSSEDVFTIIQSPKI